MLRRKERFFSRKCTPHIIIMISHLLEVCTKVTGRTGYKSQNARSHVVAFFSMLTLRVRVATSTPSRPGLGGKRVPLLWTWTLIIGTSYLHTLCTTHDADLSTVRNLYMYRRPFEDQSFKFFQIYYELSLFMSGSTRFVTCANLICNLRKPRFVTRLLSRPVSMGERNTVRV